MADQNEKMPEGLRLLDLPEIRYSVEVDKTLYSVMAPNPQLAVHRVLERVSRTLGAYGNGELIWPDAMQIKVRTESEIESVTATA